MVDPIGRSAGVAGAGARRDVDLHDRLGGEGEHLAAPAFGSRPRSPSAPFRSTRSAPFCRRSSSSSSSGSVSQPNSTRRSATAASRRPPRHRARRRHPEQGSEPVGPNLGAVIGSAPYRSEHGTTIRCPTTRRQAAELRSSDGRPPSPIGRRLVSPGRHVGRHASLHLRTGVAV